MFVNGCDPDVYYTVRDLETATMGFRLNAVGFAVFTETFLVEA